MFKMEPKDLALTAWSLARLKIPNEMPIVRKLESAIEKAMKTVLAENYLYEADDISQLQSEVNDMIDG